MRGQQGCSIRQFVHYGISELLHQLPQLGRYFRRGLPEVVIPGRFHCRGRCRRDLWCIAGVSDIVNIKHLVWHHISQESVVLWLV